MADTFKKVVTPDADPPASASSAEDAWKDVNVEKGHQPETVKSTLNYRNMEQELEGINHRLTSLTDEKAVLEAEMVKVKIAAEA